MDKDRLQELAGVVNENLNFDQTLDRVKTAIDPMFDDDYGRTLLQELAEFITTNLNEVR